MQRMHTLTLAGLLFAIAATASIAGTRPETERVDDFSWSENGQSLALHSRNDSGVLVSRAEPAPFHGLESGDVIVAVDGKPVRQVEQVTRALRDRTTPVALRVRRGQTETTLVWS